MNRDVYDIMKDKGERGFAAPFIDVRSFEKE